MDKEKLKGELEKWEREIALDHKKISAYVKRGNVLDDLGQARKRWTATTVLWKSTLLTIKPIATGALY